MSDHFDGKQSIESGDLPATHLPAFAFRSSEVMRLLLDLDSCVGTDPFGMLPLFLKSTSDVLATRLSVVFWRLVRPGNLPACWIQAIVTSIPKGPITDRFHNISNV